MLDVCLLGTGGTMPLPDRALTSLFVRYNGHGFLIDCGEGTQVQLRRAGISMHGIDVILITHFHADHVTGLQGLLLSMAKSERRDPVEIIAPKGAQRIIRALCVTAPVTPFEVRITELERERVMFDIFGLRVTAQLALHSVTCYAYSLELARGAKFDPIKAREVCPDVRLWKTLQRGESVTVDGRTITPDMVLGSARRGLKLTYCTDTRPTRELTALAQNSDLLICEGMYADEEKLPKAKEKLHMTFAEAARTAKEAHAAELWFTHFSPSLTDPFQYAHYASTLFEHALIPHDLEKKALEFDKE